MSRGIDDEKKKYISALGGGKKKERARKACSPLVSNFIQDDAIDPLIIIPGIFQ